MTAPRKTARRRRASRGSGELLRTEIVAATKALLAGTDSYDAVSIRAVADAVGVTPPSIYLHFTDKDALLDAVVVDVFAELDAAMVAAGRDETEPLSRLCEYGLAYVAFAVEHPEHYRIATMARHTHGTTQPLGEVDRVLADAAFEHMRATVAQCIEAGIFGADDDAVQVTLELWVAAHGIAALMIAKPYLPWGDKRAFANRVLRAAALGHAVGALFPSDAGPPEAVAWLEHQRRR